MTSEKPQSLSKHDALKLAQIFRELGFFATALLTERMSDEQYEIEKEKLEKLDLKFQLHPLIIPDKKAWMIKKMEAKKKSLEVKEQQLEVLLLSLRADICQIQGEMAEIDFLIDCLKTDI